MLSKAVPTVHPLIYTYYVLNIKLQKNIEIFFFYYYIYTSSSSSLFLCCFFFLLDWHDDDVLHSVLDQIGGYRRLRLLQTMPIEDVNPFLSLFSFLLLHIIIIINNNNNINIIIIFVNLSFSPFFKEIHHTS